MATNESIVEVVRFTETGTDVIADKTKALAQHFADLKNQSGAYVHQHSTGLRQLANQTQTLANGVKALGAQQVTGLKNLKREQQQATDQLKRHTEAVKTLKTAALGTYLGITGLAVGMARAGLAGTVEGYRLEYAWMRLSRQLAAIAIPVVETLANTIGRVARWFENLSGPQQKFLTKLATIAVIAGPAIFALKKLFGIAAALWTLGGGGAVGAGAAAVGGRGLMTGAAMNAAGGLTGTAAAAAGLGAAGGASRIGGKLLRGAGYAGAGVLAGEAADSLIGPRAGAFARGAGVGAGIGSFIPGIGTMIGAAIGGTVNFLAELFSPSKPAAKAAEEEKRRDVTMMGTANEEAGAAHFRIQESLLQVSAAKKDEELAAREALIKAMKEEEEFRKLRESFFRPAEPGDPSIGEPLLNLSREVVRRMFSGR